MRRLKKLRLWSIGHVWVIGILIYVDDILTYLVFIASVPTIHYYYTYNLLLHGSYVYNLFSFVQTLSDVYDGVMM